MEFCLEKAIFVNRAPFDKMEIDFKNKGINVLAAVNGRGKTTILSHIVDAFYELARLHYSNEFEGKENKYYRVSSYLDNLNSNQTSYVYLRFRLNDKIVDYVDIRRKCTEAEYQDAINIIDKIPYQKISEKFGNQNNIKYWHIDSDKNDFCSFVFGNNLLTYFPSYRYELPAFLNDSYQFKVDYKMDLKFSGYLTNPIEVITGLRQIANWIMDVVLDWELYKKTQKETDTNGEVRSIDKTPELRIWRNLNEVLRKTLSSKHYEGVIRMGIGKRDSSGTRLSVVVVDKDDEISTISPNLFCLSSGELAVLCCFGELLRQADELHSNTNLEDIQGIVLIDEVDKHLHIKLQKEVLPKLFNLFPNVQFIVSSHSPFLNMGLADEASERTRIFDLDNNGIACEPTNNKLYQEVYEMMINENQRFADKCKELENKVLAINKPVIITEGKTDWKHLKAALAHFRENHEYEDIDIEILEYNFDYGDSKLHNTLNQYKTFPPKYKIIGIFDCDEDNGKKIHAEDGTRKYGENVWGMSIPVPDFRAYNESGISIEFLYKDEDLKRQDENGRRMYVTSEFNENGRLVANNQIGVKNNHDVKKYVQPENEKIQADEVIHINGDSLALSKEQFATNIVEKKGDFANVSFEAFKPVFDRLRNILQQP